MASYRYHAGRMVVTEEGGSWRVKIKTKNKQVFLPLNATEINQAILEAEQLYADARSLGNTKPRCMQCIHWELIKADCNVGCPEGRMTGGSFAKDCAYFWQHPD
tara:strand:+ start:9723 stop:10034 length:312 start_codon:yes stop_codon:yes gene_type:complete